MADSFGGDFYLAQQPNRGKAALFSPRDIAGLQLWFDASDATTITESGGSVSQWNDKSGNANNATQATGSAQPTIQTAAQNGLNTLRFTEASLQYMSLTSDVNTDSAHTICAVVRRGGPAGANTLYVLSRDTTFTFPLQWYSDMNLNHMDSAGFQEALNITSTAYNLVVGDKTGTTGHWYLNGGSDIAFTHTNAVTATMILNRIGRRGDGLYSNGEMAEFFLYNTVLSDDDRHACERYLKQKWGTP